MTRWEEKFLKHTEKTAEDHINIKDLIIGKVTSINPLEIFCDGLPLYEKNLYINSSLLEHTREFETLTGTVGDSTMTITNGFITFKTELKDEDYVVLKEVDEKRYHLLYKISGV